MDSNPTICEEKLTSNPNRNPPFLLGLLVNIYIYIYIYIYIFCQTLYICIYIYFL